MKGFNLAALDASGSWQRPALIQLFLFCHSTTSRALYKFASLRVLVAVVKEGIMHVWHALITLHIHWIQFERNDLLDFGIAVVSQAHKDLIVEENHVRFLVIASP